MHQCFDRGPGPSHKRNGARDWRGRERLREPHAARCEAIEGGHTPGLGLLLRPEILLPILGLAVLALLPVLYRLRRSAAP